MPQLHLYVPDELAAEIARRAEARGLSVSRYLADLVRAEVAGGWPEDFFGSVVGGWAGPALERAPQPPLEVRSAG